jgi:hypothetical protein
MTTGTVDPIELFARLNPVSAEALTELAYGPEREATFARIVAKREARPARRRRIPRRRLVAAVVVALALAIPALAFSGALDSLFGFSNQGSPPEQDVQWIVDSVQRLTGEAPSSVVQLASRDGWTFYEARTSTDVCYYDAPPAQSESGGNRLPNPEGGDCKNLAGDSDFPSPSRPIFNMSHYLGVPPEMSVVTLVGVAADGVSSVQLLAESDCHVVVNAPVIDNVYLVDNLPATPEAEIVARDAGGKVLWHQAIDAAVEPKPATETTCGLG